MCIYVHRISATSETGVNKIIAALNRYLLGAWSVGYIIYWCVIILFHVFAFLTTFPGIFNSGTSPRRFY